jgi:penicillin amidase
MTKLFKYFGWIIIVLLLIVLTVISYLYLATNNPQSGTLKLKGLIGIVNIQRDHYGVPHITAINDDKDALFALGFVHAQDRFWQMEFQRRVAQGTLSEIFGSATLDQDKYLRTWGFYRAAKAAWPALDTTTKSYIHSYTEGVNAFLATQNLPLPFKILRYQPNPWTDIDSIAWQKMMAWNLQSSWEDKLTNYLIEKKYGYRQIQLLQPPYPGNAPIILSNDDLKKMGVLRTLPSNSEIFISQSNLPQPTVNAFFEKIALFPEWGFLISNAFHVESGTDDKSTNNNATTLEHIDTIAALTQNLKMAKLIRTALGFQDIPGKGSNSWVVSGRLTTSGKPLLANDPHLQLEAPSIWYLAELKGPHLHVTGATIPGLPFVIIGHNEHIGWGVTDAAIDVQDLYIEPDNVTSRLTTLHEIIKVKGKPDVNYSVLISTHGPIISSISDVGKIGAHVAIQWTALAPNDTTVESFLKLNYAQNWSQFVNALSYFVTPSQNFIYADVNNNIGYYLPGKIPIRNGWSGNLPVQDDNHHQWVSYIPFNQLPYIYNPPNGFIASANNKIVSDNYPYPLTFRWATAPYRITRIVNMFRTNQPFTVVAMEKMQNDTDSYLWKDLRTELLKTHPLDTSSQTALRILSTWDGFASRQSIAATIFAFWYRELSNLMPSAIATELSWPEPLFIKQQLQIDSIFCKIQANKNCASFLSHSLQHAMQLLIKQQGNNLSSWQWGQLHVAEFKELGLGDVKQLGWIWNRAISTPGGDSTVNVGSYDPKTFIQTEGASYRQIIDFNNFNNSKYIIPLGQTDNIFSYHYDDLMSFWRNGEYLPMFFNQTTSLKNKASLLTLSPAKINNHE